MSVITQMTIQYMQTHWRPGGSAGHPVDWRTAPAFCSKKVDKLLNVVT